MPVQFQAFDGVYLERLRSGDHQTEEHFVAYCSRFIRLKLRRRLRCPSAIEDVLQETFSRVWAVLRTKEGIRQPERLGAFVNTVCNNVLNEHFRAVFREIPSEDGLAANMPDRAIGAVEVVTNRQTQCKVGRILDELPGKHRDLIRRVFFEERDRNELCRDIGVNRNYLRVLLHRAKRQFRSMYFKEMSKSLRGQATQDGVHPSRDSSGHVLRIRPRNLGRNDRLSRMTAIPCLEPAKALARRQATTLFGPGDGECRAPSTSDARQRIPERRK